MFTDKALRKQVNLEICGVYSPFAIIFIIFTHFLVHMKFIAARFPFLELLAIFGSVGGIIFSRNKEAVGCGGQASGGSRVGRGSLRNITAGHKRREQAVLPVLV